MFCRAVLLLLGVMMVEPGLAATVRVGLLHGDAQVFDYELSVIRLALENAPGQHTLEIVPLPNATQNRVFAMLNEDNPEINVFFSGYSPEREARLLQVDIPLTRGLLGYRLFAVRKDRIGTLQGIDTLHELQAVTIGSGDGWPENRIMRYNALQVVTSQYDNLWRMLDYGRFDLFHRGVQEIFTELAKPGRDDLAILPGVAMAMRYDYFIYVPKFRDDLYQILLSGLQNAYSNGAFMANFNAHPAIRAALDRSDLDQRTIIWLSMPDARDTLKNIPATYWHQPGH